MTNQMALFDIFSLEVMWQLALPGEVVTLVTSKTSCDVTQCYPVLFSPSEPTSSVYHTFREVYETFELIPKTVNITFILSVLLR